MTQIMTNKELKAMINDTKHFNGGLGLLVPHSLAKQLRKMGITEGYCEDAEEDAEITTTSEEE